MQVRLLRDRDGVHPDWNPHRRPGPNNPSSTVIPAGTVLEDPLAYYLCVDDPDNPSAEPVDDEAKEMVDWLNERRQRKLDQRQKAREQQKQKAAAAAAKGKK